MSISLGGQCSNSMYMFVSKDMAEIAACSNTINVVLNYLVQFWAISASLMSALTTRAVAMCGLEG